MKTQERWGTVGREGVWGQMCSEGSGGLPESIPSLGPPTTHTTTHLPPYPRQPGSLLRTGGPREPQLNVPPPPTFSGLGPQVNSEWPWAVTLTPVPVEATLREKIPCGPPSRD